MIRSILEMFGLFERRIRIGLNTGTELPKKSHGIVTLRENQGNVQHLSFVVDKPEYFEKPTLTLIDSLFEQLQRLGYEPLTIEFSNSCERMAYRYGCLRPILVQPL